MCGEYFVSFLIIILFACPLRKSGCDGLVHHLTHLSHSHHPLAFCFWLFLRMAAVSGKKR